MKDASLFSPQISLSPSSNMVMMSRKNRCKEKRPDPLFSLGLLSHDFFILVHAPCVDELGDLSPTSFIKNIKAGMCRHSRFGIP
jgi:hypothetical protein